MYMCVNVLIYTHAYTDHVYVISPVGTLWAAVMACSIGTGAHTPRREARINGCTAAAACVNRTFAYSIERVNANPGAAAEGRTR